MKKIFAIFTALCIVVLIFGSCFSSWDGSDGLGNIVISVGNSGARYMAVGPGTETAEEETTEETTAVGYTIILSSDGTSITPKEISGDKDRAEFKGLQPGPWNILVHQYTKYGNKTALEKYGEADVIVRAGPNPDVVIRLQDLNWTNLGNVIKNAGENEVVMITKNLTVNRYIQIEKGQNITLLAKNAVTITKGSDFTNSMFRVPSDSSLTLGLEGGGMPGNITLDGGGRGNSSLIYVGNQRMYIVNGTETRGEPEEKGGTLIIHDRVTLTKNLVTTESSAVQRGGGVVVDNGTFDMRGGIISQNQAVYGGGVRVLSGTFTKTGGKIYGNDDTAGDEKNTATGHQGHAVYFGDNNGNNRDETAGLDDDFIDGQWGKKQ
ncbi:MAG: hypothetical protein FWF55_09275 [Treponema sp.]|nr:hypothetical protein [Treponema sp.]